MAQEASQLRTRIVALLMRSPLARRIAARQFSNRFIGGLWRGFSRRVRHGTGRITVGPAAGLLIDVGGSHVTYAIGNAEEPVQQALVDELRPGMSVLDIGGNIGFMALLAARLVGPEGNVTVLEPVPGNTEIVRGNAARNGFDHVRVLPIAASDEDGRGRMYVSRVSAFSRLTTTNVPTGADHEIDVEVARVDTLIDNGVIPVPDLVKVDVEGAEIDVVNGMRETLARHRPLVILEVHDTNRDYAELMAQLDYRVVNLDEDVPVELGHRNAHTLASPTSR
jgi:FkbM family methyltransferase